MVESYLQGNQKHIVLKPNSSMSWATNKKILLAMLAVNMVIGVAFALVGAWLILPFAGLEILLVGTGMYYVCWKLNFKETITIESQNFRLQKGVYYPKQDWNWQTSNTVLVSQASPYRLSPPTLFLKHLNEQIEIGQFLNRDEKKKLRDTLVSWGVPVSLLAKP